MRLFFTFQRIFFRHFIKKLAELEISESKCACFSLFSVYFVEKKTKKLAELEISEAKSSAIQNNSVTLSSASIAMIDCKSLYLINIKLQQISPPTPFTDN